MRVLACDPVHKLFFVGVREKEIKDQLMPLQKNLLEEYSHDLWPTLWVSAEETMKKEIAAQKSIKENPYTSKTIDFSAYVHEPPTFDAFIVTNPQLDELFFVPFNYFSPTLWRGDGKWSEFDKKDITKIVQINGLPFTHKGGVPYKTGFNYTKEDAENLLAETRDSLPKWKKKGPKYVFQRIMGYFRKYMLYPSEMCDLLSEAGVNLPSSFWNQDDAHLRMQSGYFEEKERLDFSKRDWKKETKVLDKMKENGFSQGDVETKLFGDFFDGVIDWDTFYGFYCGYKPYDDLIGKSLEEQKKWLWLEMRKTGSSL